jgi:EAL domain-containing protein (putative c-di-GMP-specific phosphodiesterase class I)
VHYQPIVALRSRQCTGFEALLRWKRNGMTVSPATFVPLAEELGLIEPLGQWVLEEACRRFAGWREQFPDSSLECVTVNVSARQIRQQGFVDVVRAAVDAADVKPSEVCLEITETALMDQPALAAEVLGDLRAYGVKIYLDDFGTGYSSLSHLHNLPVDALKIDRLFVRSLMDSDRPAIVESILGLARTLHTTVIAEGVEAEEQARELRRLGCKKAQGFFFSPPLSTAAVHDLLLQAQPLPLVAPAHHHTAPAGPESHAPMAGGA